MDKERPLDRSVIRGTIPIDDFNTGPCSPLERFGDIHRSGLTVRVNAPPSPYQWVVYGVGITTENHTPFRFEQDFNEPPMVIVAGLHRIVFIVTPSAEDIRWVKVECRVLGIPFRYDVDSVPTLNLNGPHSFDHRIQRVLSSEPTVSVIDSSVTRPISGRTQSLA